MEIKFEGDEVAEILKEYIASKLGVDMSNKKVVSQHYYDEYKVLVLADQKEEA